MKADLITPAERLTPVRRSKLMDWLEEVWLRYLLRGAVDELDTAQKYDVAAQWRGQVVKLRDKLEALGLDPDVEIIPITKDVNFWICIAIVAVTLFVVVAFIGYRSALAELIQQSMSR